MQDLGGCTKIKDPCCRPQVVGYTYLEDPNKVPPNIEDPHVEAYGNSWQVIAMPCWLHARRLGSDTCFNDLISCPNPDFSWEPYREAVCNHLGRLIQLGLSENGGILFYLAEKRGAPVKCPIGLFCKLPWCLRHWLHDGLQCTLRHVCLQQKLPARRNIWQKPMKALDLRSQDLSNNHAVHWIG